MWGSFIKAIFKGEHSLSPWTWIVSLFALGYAIWPLDIIPDYLTGPLGVVDDLGVWGIVVGLMRWELGRFQAELAAKAVTPQSPPKTTRES